MNRIHRTLLNARLPLAVGLLTSLVGGCASVPPPPTASLQAAQQAISNAERVEASRYDAGDLAEARTRLASADAAVLEKKMDLAAQLASESRADAELAAAKAAASKANGVNDDMKRSNGTLVDEMKRSSGEPK
jgi:uncharacterized protein DUF4398